MANIPILPYPYHSRSYSDIQPFTERDGLTFVRTLAELQEYMRDVVVPHLDSQYNDLVTDWNSISDELVEKVNTSIASGETANALKIAELLAAFDVVVQQIITSSIEMSDPVFEGLLLNAQSQSRVWLDAKYASTTALDATNTEVATKASNTALAATNIEVATKATVTALAATNTALAATNTALADTDAEVALKEDTLYARARYALKSDAGQRLISRLDQGQSATLGFAGDSTGEASGMYPYAIADLMAAKYPGLRVNIFQTDDNGVLLPAVTLQGGGTRGLLPTPIMEDRFTYNATDIIGQTPSVLGGSAWTAFTDNAAGDWSAAGAGAVNTGGSPRGMHAYFTSSNSDQDCEWIYVAPDNAPTANDVIHFYLKMASQSNYIYARLERYSDGTYRQYMRKVIDNEMTVIADTGIRPAPANRRYTIRVHAGAIGRMYATTSWHSFTLNDVEIAKLTDEFGTRAGFGKTDSSISGGTIESMRIGLGGELSQQTLTIYNGCKSSSTFSWQVTRLEDLYPVPLDMFIASGGHNYGPTGTPEDFILSCEVLLDGVMALHPDTGVAFSSQNPRRYPTNAASRVAHADRFAALAAWAKIRNIGYIPVYEAFIREGGSVDSQLATTLNSAIIADGIHISESGSVQWAGYIMDYLNKFSVI